MSIYENDDYKLALKATMLTRRSQFGARFTYQKMADACGIQKTYLSKVLNHDGNLNSEQLFKAASYLKLNTEETDFILLLREKQLAIDFQYKESLNKKILDKKKANLKSDAFIKTDSKELSETDKVLYYTNTDLQLVHLFMTIPEYNKSPNKIAELIGVDKSKLNSLLISLQNLGYIVYKKGTYIVKEPLSHLSEDSPIFIAYSILNRVKTIEKLRKTKIIENNDYFFSVFLSTGSSFQVKFKKKLLKFLADTQKEVINSSSEEVFQLNIDFLKWS